MNNRQKAKRFKRLYEASLAKPVIERRIYGNEYEHWVARKTFDRDLSLSEDQMLDLAAAYFCQEIREIIREKIELKKIYEYFQTQETLHIFFEKNEKR